MGAGGRRRRRRSGFVTGPATVSAVDQAHLHLADATLGVVGLGQIGSEIARRGLAFGMRVLAVDPVQTAAPPGVAALWRLDRLPELLGASDFVVIAAPHTPETVKLFGRAQFRQMKPPPAGCGSVMCTLRRRFRIAHLSLAQRAWPAPDLSTTGRAVVLPSLPQPKATWSASPSITSVPSSEALKSRKRDQVKGSALLRHRIQRVPMESRRAIVTPVDKGRKTKAPKASIKKGSVSVIAAKCDELFPPSRPAFRVRNQACHQIYG